MISDRDLARQVEEMLEEDFAASETMPPDAYERKPWWFRLGVRLARLTSPLQ